MEGQRTFTYPNAIVRVHFPDLSDEEQKRRMKKIQTAATELLKEVEVRKREIK
jgi:formiminotetrahydrofolate cyclodeaminase